MDCDEIIELEMDWDAIIKRVRSGMTRNIDGDWLCQDRKRLLDEIESYKRELDKAGKVLVDDSWRFGDNEMMEYYENCNE